MARRWWGMYSNHDGAFFPGSQQFGGTACLCKCAAGNHSTKEAFVVGSSDYTGFLALPQILCELQFPNL